MLARRLVLAAFAFTLFALAPAHAQDKVKVVTTFSILADLAKNVGGDRVEIVSLVPVNGDAHVYAPSPADAKKLADARVVFTNGLGFEGWIPRLVKSSATKAAVVVATKGIKPRKSEEKGHGHGHSHDADADPHAWQSVANAKLYVANIRDALIAADPAGKGTYDDNATTYTNKLDRLEAEVKAEVARIPADRRRIITTHDAFG
jgi:zinc/manganese transport system substrate-binding protein